MLVTKSNSDQNKTSKTPVVFKIKLKNEKAATTKKKPRTNSIRAEKLKETLKSIKAQEFKVDQVLE